MPLPGVPPLLLLLAVAVVGVAAAAVVLPRPGVALALFVGVAVTGVSDAVGYVGPLSLYLLALAAATASLLLGLRDRRLRLHGSPVLLAALLFLGSRALSIPAAVDPAAAVSTVLAEAKDVFVLVVVVLLFAGLPRPRHVVAVAVLGLAALAGLSLIQEFAFSNSTTFGSLSNVPLPSELPGLDGRHSGPESDVNFWGRTLVLFVPLALSLAYCRRGGARWLWLGAAAAMCGGVYLTQSRGSLLTLGVVVALWCLLYLRSITKVAVGVVALGAVMAVAVPGVGARLATLASATNTGPSADQSLIDRSAVQRVGWAMALEAPLVGVGAGNFTIAQPDYRRRIAPELSTITAPHNIYLEMLAEGGVVGLGGWLALFGTALWVGIRALRRLRALDGRGPPSAATLLAIGSLTGLAGWAIAAAVLHLADFAVLLTVMGVLAALDIRTRALAPAPTAAPVHRAAARRARTVRLAALATAGAVTVAAVLAVATLQLRPQPTVYVARAAVLTVPAVPAPSAYVYDVMSRTAVVATYAALLRSRSVLATAAGRLGLETIDGVTVEVDQTGLSGAFTVSVSSGSADVASRLAPALVAAVADVVESESALYALRDVA